MLETGEYGTLRELAKAEQINPSYVSRILRLTLLSPALVETILDGGQQDEVTAGRLLKPFPAFRHQQLAAFLSEGSTPPA